MAAAGEGGDGPRARPSKGGGSRPDGVSKKDRIKQEKAALLLPESFTAWLRQDDVHLADIGANLTSGRFHDLDEVLARAQSGRVSRIVVTGTCVR